MKVSCFQCVFNGAHARYVVNCSDFGQMVHLTVCPEGPVDPKDLADFQRWLEATHEKSIRKPTYAALPGFNALIVPEEKGGSSLMVLCPGLQLDQHFHRN